MNIDQNMLGQMLNMIPYPIGKDQLVKFAKDRGANDQIVGGLNMLPNMSFNSAQELKDKLVSLNILKN